METMSEEMKQMKKEIEVLRKKTFYSFLIFNIAVMMNMVIVFTFSMKMLNKYRVIQNYYSSSLDRDSELIDYLAETNEMLEKAISKIQ